jgi:hypothetical protein
MPWEWQRVGHQICRIKGGRGSEFVPMILTFNIPLALEQLMRTLDFLNSYASLRG